MSKKDRSIITGDWHLGLVNDSWLDKNGVESKINESFKQIDYMIDYADKNKIMKMKILGDTYNGKRPSPLINEMLIQRLNRLEEMEVETDILLGNHEASNSSKNALVPLKKIRYKHIKIWDEIGAKDEDGIRYIFCPHIVKSAIGLRFDESNDDQMGKYLKKQIQGLVKSKTIILGHFQWKGAISGSEETILEGGINLFPDIDRNNILRVFVGHIHKMQLLKWGGVEVIYPGNITRCDFGERDEDKGFILYDASNDEWEFEKLNTIEYKQIIINLVDKDVVNLNEDRIKELVNGKILKIIINVSEQNLKKLNIEAIETAFGKYAHISKIERNTIKDEKGKKKKKFSLNPEVVFRQHIENNIDGEKKQQGLINLGLGVIEEVKERLDR